MQTNSLLEDFRRSWSQHFSTQMLTLLVLSASFTVIFAVASIVGNLKGILTKWGSEAQMTVFLEEDLSLAKVSQIESALKDLKDFSTVHYIDKKEAKTRFIQQVPGFAKDVIEDPEFENPFPASFQLGGISPTRFSVLPNLADQIKKIAGVEDISYGQDWIQNYSGFVTSLSKSGIFLILTLIIGSVMVIGNSIRVSLWQRREEIEILELVGATASRIRTPYVFEGAMMGGMASIIGILMSYGLYRLELRVMEHEMSFLGMHQIFSFFGPLVVLAFVLLGTTTGAIGAFICVRKINTGWAAAKVGRS